MSGFDFATLELDEVNQLAESFDRTDWKTAKPPTGWSATKSQKRHEEDRRFLAERASFNGAGSPVKEESTQGPALPFRIKQVNVCPQSIGVREMYSVSVITGPDTANVHTVQG